MWISKDKWERVQSRLDELEGQVRYLHASNRITVYEEVSPNMRPFYTFHDLATQDVSLIDAVQKILDKLGMQLRYVKGSPAKIEIEKAKK